MKAESARDIWRREHAVEIQERILREKEMHDAILLEAKQDLMQFYENQKREMKELATRALDRQKMIEAEIQMVEQEAEFGSTKDIWSKVHEIVSQVADSEPNLHRLIKAASLKTPPAPSASHPNTTPANLSQANPTPASSNIPAADLLEEI